MYHTLLANSFKKEAKNLIKQANSFKEVHQGLSPIKIKLRFSELRNKVTTTPASKIYPEVISLIKEVIHRTLNLTVHDTQIMGAYALLQGRLTEMKTGEGKTLVVAIASAIQALDDKGVHVVTVNEYLAKRDCETMRPIFESLGLSVGCTLSGMSDEDKQKAYACNITYGVNSEFGFDYLRDNLVKSLSARVQRPLLYACIIDEVDSILIDEARTPLIISGTGTNQEQLVRLAVQVGLSVPESVLKVDYKKQSATLTNEGYSEIENQLIQLGYITESTQLYTVEKMAILQVLSSVLQVRFFYKKNIQYVVENGQVIIVDESTGRKMQGRRWGDFLHQIIEVIEGVTVNAETATIASITYQNYFGKYQKLSGLTGTAYTERQEFSEVYGLEVVCIPTNKPIQRIDHPDLIFATHHAKFNALLEDVKKRHAQKQPVLIGVPDVNVSEEVSKWLSAHGLPHEVLNAKNHAREADIIAQAGLPGAITVATNMAGRGTDIILGGHPPSVGAMTADELLEANADWKEKHGAVLKAGGLAVIGVGRNDSRRVDNQLIGRSGRQGDKGESQFYLSLEDDLLRHFGNNRTIRAVIGEDSTEAVSSSLIDKVVFKAQKAKENLGFEYRKGVLKFDKVISEQREAIYAWRTQLLQENPHEVYEGFMTEILEGMFHEYTPKNVDQEYWQLPEFSKAVEEVFNLKSEFDIETIKDAKTWQNEVYTAFTQMMSQMLNRFEPEQLTQLLLQTVDNHWQEQLTQLMHLQESVQLRTIAQKNAQFEFSRESFQQFELMRKSIAKTCVWLIFGGMESIQAQQATQTPPPSNKKTGVFYGIRSNQMPRRMQACSCGSGLKYKDCCGLITGTIYPIQPWMPKQTG